MAELAIGRNPAPAKAVPFREPLALREVLFASDLSPRSDRALPHAKLLADTFGATLTLYHAVEDDAAKDDAVGAEVGRRNAEEAHAHLDYLAGSLGGRCQVVVERQAWASGALVTHIHATRPDIVVMATHGRHGFAHLFKGSVTEMALQHGHRPVLCVREPDHGAALPYRRIVLPTDLSEASRRAFPLAALLARGFGAELLVVHVARAPHPAALAGVPELVESQVPAEERVRRFAEPELAGVRSGVRLEFGSPWDRVIEAARLEKADVIVMSTHGHDSLRDEILGSHTERVVRQAPCPVLVV